ncbi:MAG: entericidin A/B family lipoprotein [Alphaproteobacteria bacterium]
MTAKRIFMVLVVSTALAACNTISGMGQDLEATGEAISGSAENTKEKIK